MDTLDNTAGLGIRAGFQHEMFGATSEENVARVKRQNERKISVVIGNPPYNANQQNENDNNKNRDYKRIDELIKASYIRLSTAQKTKVYDMYARFFRWASDRLHDDGILAFVTNRSFVESRTFDGFRRDVANDFHEIYVVDLGGDVRANPKLSGTKNNVFGIQTGVAISFMVRRRKREGCKVFYARRPELDTAEDKLTFLANTPASAIPFQRVEPDKQGNWINLSENDWDHFLPVADKKTKAAKTKGQERAIFRLYSLGVVTNRDEWVYDFDRFNLQKKVSELASGFERMGQQVGGKPPAIEDAALSDEIKWTRSLKSTLRANKPLRISEEDQRLSLYRPFVKKHLCFSPALNEFQYQTPEIWPNSHSENYVIGFTVGGRLGFFPFVSSVVPSLTVMSLDANQLLPRYRYTASGERVDNVTDWALKAFRAHYGAVAASAVALAKQNPSSPAGPSPHRGEETSFTASRLSETAGETERTHASTSTEERHSSPLRGEGGPAHSAGTGEGQGATRPDGGDAISKDDVFHYVYAALHDPLYRETYAINLKREFPRVPFHPDFHRWAAWGRELMRLHIGYETVEPWPLRRIDEPDAKARGAGVSPRPILKSDPASGTIRVDSETQLADVPPEAWRYRLGNRSGVDWVLDQHKEKTPKDPTIRERFNAYRFRDHKERVIDLLARVARVSVETVRITEAMRAAPR